MDSEPEAKKKNKKKKYECDHHTLISYEIGHL